MNIDHTDLARQAFAALPVPDPPRPLAWALTYITRLLSILPAVEAAGYVLSFPGAENTQPLGDGTLVRISRVSYSDGAIYKVLSDAPNGQPQWVPEDVRPDLYVPYAGAHTGPIPPNGSAHTLARLEGLVSELDATVNLMDVNLESLYGQLELYRQRMEAINTAFDLRVAALEKQSRDGHVHGVKLFARETGLPRTP